MAFDGADSIYFLMFPGWKTEFRSNRWHYASRWARHLPVTLVQADAGFGEIDAWSEPEPRIPGCSILHVIGNPVSFGSCLYGLHQTRQILGEMARRGHRAPIFWAYDPDFLFPFALIPSVLRIYHATENYYHFPVLPQHFTKALSTMVRAADAVIAVSPGVATSFRSEAQVPVDVITNGCDHAFYAGARPDPELTDTGAAYDRIVVYGGNINERLDLGLVHRLTEAEPRTLFAFFGRVAPLPDDDSAKWNTLALRPNFRHFGEVPAVRLPAIYAAAHLGIAPYKFRRDLIKNLFPLKIFEMLSSGLPVITSPFASLQNIDCATLCCASNEDSFLSLATQLDRRNLTKDDLQTMADLSRAQDYDTKFNQVLALAATHRAAAPTAPGAELFGLTETPLLQQWLRDTTDALRLREPRGGDLWKSLLRMVRARTIRAAQNHLPKPLRRFLRGIFPFPIE